ncbi:MAG TPA: RDD family protein [Woeseiaceae bacterium]|nr:RDD family protein [Woeseiaceae bacterium]
MVDDNPYAPPEANIEVSQSVDNELAGRWLRLGGSIIDTVILVVVFFGAIYLFGAMDGFLAGQETTTVAEDTLLLLSSLVLFVALNGYLLATKGQTIGKVAVGTRIVSIHDGSLVPLWKLMLLRYLPYFGLGYLPIGGQILSLVNALMIFKADRRCLHDHTAGTKVVVARPMSAT